MAPRPKMAQAPVDAWAAEQRRLAEVCVTQDQVDWEMHCGRFVTGLQRVGGVDVSFFGDDVYAVAAVVVLSFPKLEILYEKCAYFKLAIPYRCGFLAFREVPALKRMLDEIPADLMPQVVLVDGNGRFHPRRCGSASHLGVVANLPTIGVAKEVMHVDDITTRTAEKVAETLHSRGDWVPLIGGTSQEADSEPLAMLLRTGEGKKNLVVSTGHRVSLQTAVALTAMLCKCSIPEPIRQADLRSRSAVKAWWDGKDLKNLKLSKRSAHLLCMTQEDSAPLEASKAKRPRASKLQQVCDSDAETTCSEKKEPRTAQPMQNAVKRWRIKAVPSSEPPADLGTSRGAVAEASAMVWEKPRCDDSAEKSVKRSELSGWALAVSWLGGLCCISRE